MVIYDNRGAFFALFLGSSFSCFGVLGFRFRGLRFLHYRCLLHEAEHLLTNHSTTFLILASDSLIN